jgi:NAD-reducing hydrogenase large subunit
LPGCPPDADTIYYIFTELLEGRVPKVPVEMCDMIRRNAHERKIEINPVTRIEGHGKKTVQLDDSGQVKNARFHVTQFRGFELFSRERDFREMPVITPRICGICPVSHPLASAKACDDILGVEIPKTAKNLRDLMHMGQVVQSHALSFFHLSSPDLLFGFNADPAV